MTVITSWIVPAGASALLALSLAGCSLIINPDLGPGGGPDAGSGVVSCTTHSDCLSLGQTHVCGPSALCVNAVSDDCPTFIGPLAEDNTVIVGSIMPTVGDFRSIGRPIEQAEELAILELNDSGGLPGGRRLVLLECDSSGSREQGIAVAEHLISTVGVPVIFGPAFSSIFIDVTTQHSAPAGVMTISPSATSPTISGLDDQGLGWRTAASDTFQGNAIADLIRLRGFTKVIALGKDDAYGQGLLNRVGEELLPELGADNYFSLTFPDPGTTPNPDFATVVINALDTLPDAEVVVLLGTTEVADILDGFELVLTESSTASSMRYIMADGGKAEQTRTLAETDESLIPRVEGTEADHKNGSLYTAFALRFQQRFGEAPGIYAANAYDAAYLVAYAMSTLPADEAPTGASVAAAMTRLTESTGRPIEAGPSNINEARNTLAGGGSIDYDGASGPLDFDLTTGEAGANVARWVIEKRANGVFRFINSGAYTVTNNVGVWDLNR